MTELRITITVPLPDDLFEQAAAIARISAPLASFMDATPEGTKMEHELGAASKPATRKPRSDAGQKRTKGNGATAELPASTLRPVTT